MGRMNEMTIKHLLNGAAFCGLLLFCLTFESLVNMIL